MSERGRFVCIEGLHGTGKSVLCESMPSVLQNCVEAPTIPMSFQAARHEVDGQQDVDLRFMFYLSAVLYASQEINRLLGEGRTVVVESYIFRTIAYHMGMGSTLRFDLSRMGIPMPDASILLICSEELRSRRLSIRDKKPSYWRSRAEYFSLQIAEEYSRFPGLVALDTTSLNKDEVVQESLGILRKAGVA